MAKRLIDRIKESLAKEGVEPRSRAARQWLKAKVQNLRVSRTDFMRDRTRLKDKSLVGRMYFYFLIQNSKIVYHTTTDFHW